MLASTFAVLALLTVAAAAPAPAAVDIALVSRGGFEDGAAVRIAISGREGDGASAELQTGTAIASVPLPGGAPWQLRCVDERAWCPSIELDSPPDAPLVVPVYPKTTLRGLLEGSGRRPPPETMTVQGWVDVKRHGSLSAADAVFVERVAVEEGRFEVEIPRAPLDLRIAVPGAAPLYRWRISTAAGPLDLGVVPLHPGASISGFVTSAGGAPLSGATVEIAPLAGSSDPETEAAVQRMAQRAETDRTGFFQIADLAPGRYRLSASGRKDLSTIIEPIELAADEEVHLRSVELSPPLSLEVLLSPARPPGSSEGWTVRVTSATGPQADQRITGPGGEVTFAPLRPGRYNLLVQSGERDVVAERTIELDADLTLPIELEVIGVEGRVRLGGEPLVAEVRLETGNFDRRTFESDAEGRFGGWLRRPSWDWLLLEISSPLLPGERRLELAGSDVQVEDGVLHLDVDLEDGRIEGMLVDQLGRPVAGVEVAASRGRDPDGRTRSDAKGRFSLGALEYDSYWVTAGHPELGAIQPVRVKLSESQDSQELWLALLPMEEIAGTVVTADGQPVVAAEIAVNSLGRDFGTSATTDAGGGFRARVLSGTGHVSVVVFAPSHGLWAGCLPVDEERRLAVSLPPGAPGTLQLAFDWVQDLPPAPGDIGLVSESGGRISASLIGYWTAKNAPQGPSDAAGVQVVPAVTPGAWALKWTDEPSWLALQTACGSVPGGSYEWRNLPAGGAAEIRYDVEPHQRERLEDNGSRSSAAAAAGLVH